jgi:hypothetical protein
MEITLALEQMSIKEKIRAMEIIWDDLCQNADNISSPTWHKDILAEREELLKNGNAEFTDWNEAKESIRQKLL